MDGHEIGYLFKHGAPEIKFQKIQSVSTNHTFNHLTALSTQKDFQILEEFVIPAEQFHSASEPSIFLAEMSYRRKKRKTGENSLTYMFPNEADIQATVVNFVKDLLSIVGGDLDIVAKCSMVNEKGPKHSTHRHDFWIIHADGCPVTVVVVKSPLPDRQGVVDNGGILRDDKVLGQLFDYITSIRQFYGRKELFGIVTTLKHWRLVWLPSADNMAALSTLQELSNEPVSGAGDPNARAIHVSLVYALTAPELIPTLLSAIRKSQHSRRDAVPIFSNKRAYLKLLTDTWEWHRPSVEDAANMATTVTLALKKPTTEYVEVLVLKYLHLRPTLKVWLGVVWKTDCSPFNSLCVVKQVESRAAAERVARLWTKINHCYDVFVQRVSGEEAVLMPFVLLAEEKEVGGQCTVAFNFDPAHWISQKGVTVSDVPAALRNLAEKLRAIAGTSGLWNPKVAAIQVIQHLSQHNMHHDDLEWRHIALIPVFDEQGQLVSVRPGLIDLESVKENVPANKALEKMMTRLEEISKKV